MNTTEKNSKLIVIFMDWKEVGFIQECYYIPEGFELIIEQETTIEGNNCEILEEQDSCSPDAMKFHTSWEWLMPVVEKIENFHPYQDFIIGGNRAILESYSSVEELYSGIFDGDSKIEATYKAVIAFIGWYNKQK